jgi:NADPH:quinone reductase-like Zn-dependent oxidoreductase
MSSGRKDVKRRKMRALQVVSLGDPCGPLDGSVLQLGQDFSPVLASGDIRVRIEAASLNFADLLQAQVEPLTN